MTNSNEALRAAQRLAVFCDQWGKGRHNGDQIHGVGFGNGEEARLTVTDIREVVAALAPSPVAGGDLREAAAPLDMLLWCPKCNAQHIDEPSEGWANPPHRSHLCHDCGCIWRPADVATNGVADIKTAGDADTWGWTGEDSLLPSLGKRLTAALNQPAAPVGDEPTAMVPRYPTERMMDAGLYQMRGGDRWSDLFQAWVDMFDTLMQDGGCTPSLPAAPVEALDPVGQVRVEANGEWILKGWATNLPEGVHWLYAHPPKPAASTVAQGEVVAINWKAEWEAASSANIRMSDALSRICDLGCCGQKGGLQAALDIAVSALPTTHHKGSSDGQ